MPPLALRPAEWSIVRAILARLVPDRPVWAFGSRTTGRCKPYSDLDLAVGGAQRLPAALLAELSDAFVTSDLPFKVDVLDWAAANASFKTLVRPLRVLVQQGRQDDRDDMQAWIAAATRGLGDDFRDDINLGTDAPRDPPD
jgi:type I restriction enzyme S subunit